MAAPRFNPRTGSFFTLEKSSLPSSPPVDKEVSPFNPNISRGKEDILYHLGLSNHQDLPGLFGDVKFVCMGGSAKRMHVFAKLLVERGLVNIPAGFEVAPIGKTERYSLYKVGPVISVNHGMGMASMSILLNELVKLLFHAKAENVIFIRIGTSGGLGLDPGTVVLGSEGVNSFDFTPVFSLPVLGEIRQYPSVFDAGLICDVLECAKSLQGIECVVGKTMSTDDFYEGQARRDGAFCDYGEEEREEYLQKAYDAGVRNIEMEGLLFGAFCKRVGIRAILCNTVVLNRFCGDQVQSTPEELEKMSANSLEVISHYIFHSLQMNGK